MLTNLGGWPRLDPRIGINLCESCWNEQGGIHACARGDCECPKCNPPKGRRAALKDKPVQESISMEGAEFISARS